VVSSNYYKSGLNCSTSTRSGVWISSDPGAIAFSGGCLSPPTNDRYCCDPVSAAYSDSTGIGNKYYTGFIANDSAATLCGYCDVLLRSSTNGGRSWSSPFGSLEALDYDLSDTQRVHHRVYLEDFGHMIVDSTGGTYDGCGYVAAMNFEINDAEHEIEVAHGCPADTGTWTNVAVDTELTGGVIDFVHLAIDTSGTIYLTYTKCATDPCATTRGGTTAKIYFSKSTDGGSTWSSPINIFNITMSPVFFK